jgi:hypothetical protein
MNVFCSHPIEEMYTITHCDVQNVPVCDVLNVPFALYNSLTGLEILL